MTYKLDTKLIMYFKGTGNVFGNESGWIGMIGKTLPMDRHGQIGITYGIVYRFGKSIDFKCFDRCTLICYCLMDPPRVNSRWSYLSSSDLVGSTRLFTNNGGGGAYKVMVEDFGHV